MGTEANNIFDVSRSIDAIDARRAHQKKDERDAKPVLRRISRPTQVALKTTPEMKRLLERLAKMRGISQVEMFEYALTVMADAMDRHASAEKKGKRK
jgi:hypothetical protein